VQLLEMNWPQVAALPKTTPVVVPIAALEQHGRHMPVFTDSLLLGEVVRRVAQTMNDRVLFVPLTWLGNSHHHLDFPGTMSASPRLYLDLLIDMAENLLHHGFQRIVLLNGHGGNIVPAQQALFELRQRYRERNDLLLVSTTYWTLGSDPAASDPTIKQRRMGHACEWETSMMLRIAPQLVGDLSKVEAVEFGNAFEPAHRAWITKERTTPGHIGDPRPATAEKGETLFKVFAGDVIALLERVIAWDGKSWEG
jgi:creatinine amidohydrolase